MMISIAETRRQRGFTLIEVLIALVIIAVGLLGVAGLQLSSLQNQLEAYQRAQAVMLAEEMAHRIRANAPAARSVARPYVAGTQYGLLTPASCDPNSITTAAYDLCDWNNSLAGQGVSLGGVNAGSVNAARGCIEYLPSTADGETRIRVTVAWQGTVATLDPNSSCGVGAFGDNDAFRRVAVTDVVLADLAN
jgi:type IV pilus assembly protein PilV